MLDAMSDLTDALTTHTRRVEEAVATGGRDALLDLHVGSSMGCTYTLRLTATDSPGPRVVAHAALDPGGLIAEAHLEARDGDRSATVDIEPGTPLWQAVQWHATEAWDTGYNPDDVPPDVDVWTVPALHLQPGDEVLRLGMTVTGYEHAGRDTRGQVLLAVRFEGSVGAEVWPADRALSVIRPV